jgi:osmotically-inducible protein OsmY
MSAVALLVLLSMTALAATGRYDQQIQQAVSTKVQDSKQLQNVKSSVEDGIVTLTGTVDVYQDKLDAAKKVKKLANVAGVRNQITVAGERDSRYETGEEAANDRIAIATTRSTI